MPIPPMFLHSCTAQNCELLKHVPSTVHCARHTGSPSAQSKRSVLLPRQRSLNDKRVSSRRNRLTETVAVPKSAIASAKSFASTSSIPTWSSPTPWTSAGPRPYARPPASRSRTLSLTSPTGPRKIATLSSASSTVISLRKKGPHEALLRESSSCGSVGHRLRSRRIIPGPCRSSAVSLAPAKTVLPDPLRCSRTEASGRVLDYRRPLLDAPSHVEIELVLARLRLRHRAAGKRRNR